MWDADKAGGTGARFSPRDLLRPALLVLHLVHRPHRPLHVLHTHEALVEAEVVAHGVLRDRGTW